MDKIPESDLIDDKLEALIQSKIPEDLTEEDKEEAFEAIGDVVFAVITDLVDAEKIGEFPEFEASDAEKKTWLDASYQKIVDAVNAVEMEDYDSEDEEAE